MADDDYSDPPNISYESDGKDWIAFDEFGNAGAGRTRREARHELESLISAAASRPAAKPETRDPISIEAAQAGVTLAKTATTTPEEIERERRFNESLGPYIKAIGKLKDRNDSRRENGIGQRESDKRKKNAKELEGFEYPYPPIEIDQSGQDWFAPLSAKPVPPTPEAVAEWQKNARNAANKYRHAQRNRAKQPSMTAAAAEKRDKKNRARQAKQLKAQGWTHEMIAKELSCCKKTIQRYLKTTL